MHWGGSLKIATLDAVGGYLFLGMPFRMVVLISVIRFMGLLLPGVLRQLWIMVSEQDPISIMVFWSLF